MVKLSNHMSYFSICFIINKNAKNSLTVLIRLRFKTINSMATKILLQYKSEKAKMFLMNKGDE